MEKLNIFCLSDAVLTALITYVRAAITVGFVVFVILILITLIIRWWRRWLFFGSRPVGGFLPLGGVAPIATASAALVIALAIIIPLRWSASLVGRPSFRRGRALVWTLGRSGL